MIRGYYANRYHGTISFRDWSESLMAQKRINLHAVQSNTIQCLSDQFKHVQPIPASSIYNETISSQKPATYLASRIRNFAKSADNVPINQTDNKCQGTYIAGHVGSGKTMISSMLADFIRMKANHTTVLQYHWHAILHILEYLKVSNKPFTHDLDPACLPEPKLATSFATIQSIVDSFFAAGVRYIFVDDFTLADLSDAINGVQFLSKAMVKGIHVIVTSNERLGVCSFEATQSMAQSALALSEQMTEILVETKVDFRRFESPIRNLTPEQLDIGKLLKAQITNANLSLMEVAYSLWNDLIPDYRLKTQFRSGIRLTGFSPLRKIAICKFEQLLRSNKSKYDFTAFVTGKIKTLVVHDTFPLDVKHDGDQIVLLRDLLDLLYLYGIDVILEPRMPPLSILKDASEVLTEAARLCETMIRSGTAQPSECLKNTHEKLYGGPLTIEMFQSYLCFYALNGPISSLPKFLDAMFGSVCDDSLSRAKWIAAKALPLKDDPDDKVRSGLCIARMLSRLAEGHSKADRMLSSAGIGRTASIPVSYS